MGALYSEETGGQHHPFPSLLAGQDMATWIRETEEDQLVICLSLSHTHTHSNQPASHSEEGPDQNLFESMCCVHTQSLNRV